MTLKTEPGSGESGTTRVSYQPDIKDLIRSGYDVSCMALRILGILRDYPVKDFSALSNGKPLEFTVLGEISDTVRQKLSAYGAEVEIDCPPVDKAVDF